MKKLIMIIFAMSLLNSCANVTDKSTSFKEKIKSGIGSKNINNMKKGLVNFKNSINNPLKKNY
jgi:PBP1b-binding outer membrane lipoprotein LpoB